MFNASPGFIVYTTCWASRKGSVQEDTCKNIEIVRENFHFSMEKMEEI